MNNQARQKLFSVITVSVSIICGVLLLEYMLGWYRESIDNSSQMDAGFMRYHPQLGWALTPDWQGKHRHHDFDVSYRTDANGFRQQPAITSDYGSPSIALLGDSFTFGFGVEDDETFAALMARADSGRNYLNFGIPGYSTDQQFLQMGQQSLKQGNTQTVNHYLLVFYLGNDILDIMLPHPLQAEPAKPYFETDGNNLTLKNIPVPQTRKPAALRHTTLNDLTYGNALAAYTGLDDLLISKSEILQWLLPAKADATQAELDAILAERLADNRQLLFVLLKAMHEEARRQNASFSIAILPGSSWINSPQSYSFYFQEHVRNALLQMAEQLGIDSIDLATGLKPHADRELYFPNERHLTRFGNEIVADLLLQHLNRVEK